MLGHEGVQFRGTKLEQQSSRWHRKLLEPDLRQTPAGTSDICGRMNVTLRPQRMRCSDYYRARAPRATANDG